MAPALGRIEGVDGACLENENENEKEREGGKRLCLKKKLVQASRVHMSMWMEWTLLQQSVIVDSYSKYTRPTSAAPSLSPTHAAQQQSSQQPQPQPPSQQHANRRRAVDRERVSCAPKKAASRASRESRVERERAHGRVRATGPRQSHGQKPKTSKGSSQRQPPAHAPSAISDAAPHQPTPSQPAPAPAPTTCPALPCPALHVCTRM
ncbi:hypothetical protein COCVIDRAFT_18474 [Bipolaris victoriae FI3]|uniref:Uncharacterized protein n=1 Tax=Bipolaris victoriae (strain FI3) TaxID=930091 RepID=W7EIN2_BIPV3|nr:hypothetical protein COCVIDRAFT_18474 [Bipolaris victoriae FI3]